MIKVTDSNVFYLSGTNNRFRHLATIQKDLREFILFQDVQENQIYIEELTGGNLTKIEDDGLWQELFKRVEYLITIHMGDDPFHPRSRALQWMPNLILDKSTKYFSGPFSTKRGWPY